MAAVATPQTKFHNHEIAHCSKLHGCIRLQYGDTSLEKYKSCLELENVSTQPMFQYLLVSARLLSYVFLPTWTVCPEEIGKGWREKPKMATNFIRHFTNYIGHAETHLSPFFDLKLWAIRSRCLSIQWWWWWWFRTSFKDEDVGRGPLYGSKPIFATKPSLESAWRDLHIPRSSCELNLQKFPKCVAFFDMFPSFFSVFSFSRRIFFNITRPSVASGHRHISFKNWRASCPNFHQNSRLLSSTRHFGWRIRIHRHLREKQSRQLLLYGRTEQPLLCWLDTYTCAHADIQ